MAKSSGDYNFCICYSFKEFWDLNRKNYSFNAVEVGEIMKKFAKLAHQEILNNPEGFKLPSNCGTIIIAGFEADAKDKHLSSKDKSVYHRNIKTDRIIYKTQYIYGKTRGKPLMAIMWKYRSTVPLRKQMFNYIQENRYSHWFVFDRQKDVKRLGVPAEYTKRYKN